MTLVTSDTLSGISLTDAQCRAANWLLCDVSGGRHAPRILADPVGTGKTEVVCSVLAFLDDADALEGRVLWITEGALIRQTCDRLRRYLPSLSLANSSEGWASSNPTKRAQREYAESFGVAGPDILVVSYEWASRRADWLASEDFGIAVLDEAQAIKGGSTEQQNVKRAIGTTVRRHALTATPVEVDLMELHAILDVLGAPNLPSREAWGDRFVLWSGHGRTRKAKGVNWGNYNELRKLWIHPFLMKRTEAELGLVLPGLDNETVIVPLVGPQLTAYHKAEGIHDVLKRAHGMKMATAYTDGRSVKAEAALAYLLARPHITKALVYAENLGHLDIMGDLLDRHGIRFVRIEGSTAREDRTDAVTAFRTDDSLRVVLASRVLERGVEGLQIATHLLTLGSTHNPAREEQRAGRLRRIGCPHPVVTHVTFETDTEHEARKTARVNNRESNNKTILNGLGKSDSSITNLVA